MAGVTIPPFDEAPSTVVGATLTTQFEFDFPFWDDADVLVYVDDVLLDAEDYTVEGYFVQDGDAVEGGYGSGLVTLNTAVSDCTVIIDRNVVGTRETQFSNAGPLAPRTLNSDLNRLTARQQDAARRLPAQAAALVTAAATAVAVAAAVQEVEEAGADQVAAVLAAPSIVTAGTGLNVTVLPFKVTMADGEVITYAGATLAVPASGTHYVGLDLYSGIVWVLRNKANTGTVWLAKVTTSGSAVTAIVLEPKLVVPPTCIPLTRAKMTRAYQSVTIGLLGTSLVEGAGGTPYWHDLCFNSAQSAGGYYVTLATGTTVTVTNAALGGSTARHSLMQLGRSVYSATGAFANTQMTYGARYGAQQAATPAASYAESPLFGMDLVIIGACANGGTDNVSFVENAVRLLRSRGVEVIILTENHRSDNAINLESNIPILAKIAAAYGCELADTWSYMRSAQDGGTTVLADVIHQNTAGHVVYASAVRSVMSGKAQAVSIAPLPPSRFITAASTLLAKKSPSVADIQFTPYSTTGAAVSSPVTTAAKNPAIAFGGKVAASAVTELGVGEIAYFGHAFAHAADILVELNSAFTVEVSSQDTASVLATVVNATSSLDRVFPIEAVLHGAYGAITAGLPGFQNRGLQVKCTVGTCRLVGVIFYTWPSEEIPLSAMEFFGTWAEEAGPYSRAVSKYSDTDLDRVVIPFTGTAINVVLNGQSGAGKVDVWLDGRQVHSALDLYAAGTFVYSLTVAADTDHFGRGHGDHVLMIKRNGANGSAASAASGNRRLAVLAAYALDGR